MTVHETTGFLKAIGPFCKLSEKDREEVAETPVKEQFPPGERALEQRSYKNAIPGELGITQVESYIYTKTIKEMISPVDKFIHEKETIRDVAKVLIERKTGSLVVTDDRGSPRGVVSVRKILKSILFDHIDPEEAIEKVVDKKFFSIGSDCYFFDALHTMIQNKVSTLVVTDGDRTVGVLTGLDLLRFRGREVLSLVRNIENAHSLTQLNAMRKETEKVLREIMVDGAPASQACKIISEFNDRVVAKVIQFAEEGCGPPPCPYAWLSVGSEGRKEQTLFTDQDNAIIVQRWDSNNAADYFRGFSHVVVNGLNTCGIPLCKNGIMASNPKFFGDVNEWKHRVAHWVLSRDLTEKDMMDTYIFLDFRSLYGEQMLVKELKDHIMLLIRKNRSFLPSLAERVVAIPMPVGFFKKFIVEKSGEYKDRLNLKLYGLIPLVTCIKILAFHHGIVETNTLERIRALARLDAIPADQQEFLEQAFETFLTLKIRNSLAAGDEKKALGNYINPSELSTRQQRLLKEAFWAVSELQKTTKNILNLGDRANQNALIS